MFTHRIVGQFFNRPLLLTPDTADTIGKFLLSRLSEGGPDLGGGRREGENNSEKTVTYFQGQPGPDGTYTAHSPQASRFYGSYALSEDGKTPLPFRRTPEGVGIVSLIGEWVNRGAWVGASSGLISYEGFKVQMLAAANDTRTQHIVLDMESPGGQAIGAFEAADIVRRVAAVKPVTAIVNGLCASAAYAIASAATRIVCIPTGIAGSIGVVLAHLDISEYLKKEGIKPTLIHAGAHKVDGNPYEVLPAAVRADMQAEVEDFYSLFVQTVAQGRTGMTEKAIRGTEAKTFMGAEAKRVGLVDDVGTFEDLLGDLNAKARGTPLGGHSSQRGPNMTLKLDLPGVIPTAEAVAPQTPAATPPVAPAAPAAAAPAAAPEATVSAPAAPAAAAPVAPASPPPAAPTPGASIADGRASERARISAIMRSEHAKGRETLASYLAYDTDMSAEMATTLLSQSPAAAAPAPAAPAAAAPTLDQRMAGRQELALEPDNAPAEDKPSADAFWGDIRSSIGANKTAA